MSQRDRLILAFASVVSTALATAALVRAVLPWRPEVPEPRRTQLKSLDLGVPESQGSPRSLCTLVLFFDYQCPACAQVEEYLVSARKTTLANIAIVWRHFPLPQHPMARPAAIAAEAARIQGAFPAMHAALMSARGDLSPAGIRRIVKNLHLDSRQLDADCSGAGRRAVERDIVMAKRLAVHATPTLFLVRRDHSVWRVGSPAQIAALVR